VRYVLSTIAFNVALAPVTYRLARDALGSEGLGRVARLAVVSVAGAGLAIVISAMFDESAFGAARLVCWTAFAHVLPLLVLMAWKASREATARRERGRALPAALPWLLPALAVAAVGVDAFIVEPRALDVRRVTISSRKVTRRHRIVAIADLQFDDVGAHEKHALRVALEEKPDMVLLLGDYAQGDERNPELHAALREHLRSVGFSAPEGVYAVRGNVDDDAWKDAFSALPIVAIEETTRLERGELVLTGLSMAESFVPKLEVPSEPERFHVVFGHAPNFALTTRADLMLAGHTHGGQIQLPGLGAIVTMSEVPRAWADGPTHVAEDATLIVSRGVGMERRAAPRVRFLCRPDVFVIDVVPGR
jgi:uncharacterized protein